MGSALYSFKVICYVPIDQALVDAAIAQALQRYPEGYAGAAAVRTASGKVITSVAFDPPHGGASLWHETGAFCEANRLDEKVVASVCVSRSEPTRPFLVLAPFGICQERLALWGADVEVALAVAGKPDQWESKRLADIHPH